MSTLIGHFLPPTGILITPIVISITTWLIVFTKADFGVLAKSGFSYFFIGLNDIGIKLFAGGRHDMEGMGWIHLLLLAGLVPCFIMLLVGIFQDKKSSVVVKICSVLMFLLLICGHLVVFQTLGVQVN